MLAFKLMENGEEQSNQVKHQKPYTHFERTEDLTEQNKTEKRIKDDSTEDENDKRDVQDVKNSSENICKFYSLGKCKFGRTGKTPDKNGKTCEFSHPITCKMFKLFDNRENGCKGKKCEKLHLSLCKWCMRDPNCKLGDKCHFWHPKKLKKINHTTENNN